MKKGTGKKTCLDALLRLKDLQQIRKHSLQIFPVHDLIEEAVLQYELGGLESFREIFADGFFHYARACEADERAGLCNVQVAEHRIRSGVASRGRIGEQGDEWNSCVVEQ